MIVRLVMADDHPLILDGLSCLFKDDVRYRVEARCSTAEAALAAVRRYAPDVLLLDLHMPGMSSVAVVEAISAEELPTRVVILTASVDEHEALDCLRLGVAGIVLKDMEPPLLLRCVEKVAAGDVWVEKRSFSRALEHLLRREASMQGAASCLTEREMQVVRLCADGLSNADIASSLWVTEGTVKSHLHAVYQKLGVDGRASLTRFAQQNELL